MRSPTGASRRGASSRRRRSNAKSSRSLASHDATALQNSLANLLMRQGIQRFVLETLASLNHTVGDAWMRGELAVFEEHLYTEHVQIALRMAINAFPRQTGTPQGPADDLPRRAAWRRPADGRGAARTRRRAVHLARRPDAARGHSPRGARATTFTSSRCPFRRRSPSGKPATGSPRCAASSRRRSRCGRAAR